MATFAAETRALRDGRAAVVRSLEPTDAPAFVTFHHCITRETNFTMQRPEDPATVEKSEKRFGVFRDDPESLMIGVFVGGELAGVSGLHPYWPEHPWVLHSRIGMMVRQAYWGTGVAQVLMNSLFAFAERNGIRRVEGRVRVTNPRGIKFYERAGFIVEGTHRVGAVIDGQDIDELTIARVR